MEYSEAEKQMLREVLPGIAVQLRGALANIHGALGRLAPERLRDRDTGTDRSAAILCQSYYKILRVVNNLSDAPMLAEDKPLDTENVELVELLEGLCRQGQVLAELMDLRLVFTCRDRAHVIAVQIHGGCTHHTAALDGGRNALRQVEGVGDDVIRVAVAADRRSGIQLHCRFSAALGQVYGGQHGLGIHQRTVRKAGKGPVE